MTTAPFTCRACKRRIRARRAHAIIGEHIICFDCFESDEAHEQFYPACPIAGHDMFAHEVIIATGASTHRILAALSAHKPETGQA